MFDRKSVKKLPTIFLGGKDKKEDEIFVGEKNDILSDWWKQLA